MVKFKDRNELLDFANQFIPERISALEKDVKHCIETPPYAPLPAISYCFSTINLLGALSVRKRSGHRLDSDYQSRTYMETYMKYNPETAVLLQQIFRHKVVHFAIPSPLYKDDKGRSITWWYSHATTTPHLLLNRLDAPAVMPVTSIMSLTYDHEFHLSIPAFVNDIKNSVDNGKGDGYLIELVGQPDLQSIFEEAICELYDS
jgi:hypothetical protein